MNFHSILSRNSEDKIVTDSTGAPDYFGDLNLDQIVDAITAGKDEYHLKPLFYTPLRNVETIYYRHEVMQDLEDPNLMETIQGFAHSMSLVRRYLSLMEKLDFDYHKKGWFLEAALVYCEAVAGLEHRLRIANFKSRGFQAFQKHLTNYVHSSKFRSLLEDAQHVKDELSEIKYSIIIQPGKFSVRKYEEETDYSIEVEKIFEKFKQGAVKDYRIKLQDGGGMNHVEAKILEFVARLYPEQFADLDQFCDRQSHFMDETIRVFDRETNFTLLI